MDMLFGLNTHTCYCCGIIRPELHSTEAENSYTTYFIDLLYPVSPAVSQKRFFWFSTFG